MLKSLGGWVLGQCSNEAWWDGVCSSEFLQMKRSHIMGSMRGLERVPEGLTKGCMICGVNAVVSARGLHTAIGCE